MQTNIIAVACVLCVYFEAFRDAACLVEGKHNTSLACQIKIRNKCDTLK